MFNPHPDDLVDVSDQTQPLLAVVVDTEEEFDWSKPHDRSATGVTSIRFQERAQRVFEPFFSGSLLAEALPEICAKTFIFELPLRFMNDDDENALLELFQRPLRTQ